MIDSLREHAKARVHQLRVSTSSLYSFFFYPFVSLNLLTPRMTNSKFKTIQLVVLKHTFLIPNYWSSQMVASSKLVHGIKCYNHLERVAFENMLCTHNFVIFTLLAKSWKLHKLLKLPNCFNFWIQFVHTVALLSSLPKGLGKRRFSADW